MKILFVACGNTKGNVFVPFIRSQQESLRELGYDVVSFPIIGKGLRGYLKNVGPLRAYLKENPVDLIHVHYTLSGWVAILAALGRIPIILSLMGGDAEGIFVGENKVSLKSRWLTVLTWLIQPFVNAIISKSPNLEKFVYLKSKSYLIPNGVNLGMMKPLVGNWRREMELVPGKKYVLFLGNPEDSNKNIALVRAALAKLNRPDVELLSPYPIAHEAVPRYMTAADVFVLCSFTEGSPNVLKEAMSCNCPLVAVNIGDVEWVLGDTPGCHVSSHDPQEFAEKLALALDFAEKTGRTRGRDRIIELGLDTEKVAQRVADLYHQVLDVTPESIPENVG